MFERFTDRARKVMALADQEAQRFNHQYIGTEHILLGLMMEGSGVGATVLRNLGVDIEKLRAEVEKLVQSGPDTVTAGKLPPTPRARQVIVCAVEEARALNHNYVGTEHILLGLLRVSDGVAAQVLMNLGLKLEGVRTEVQRLLGVQAVQPSLPFTGGDAKAGAAVSEQTAAGGDEIRGPMGTVQGAEGIRPPGASAAGGSAGEISYENLRVWQKADELAHQVYAITAGFPKEKVWGVAAELRKAALAIPPSLTEAQHRPDRAEARWFLNSALVALAELRYLLDFALGLGCLKDNDHQTLSGLAAELEGDLRRLRASGG